jgi:formylglycine-generating enzyme required for sulfatase activity
MKPFPHLLFVVVVAVQCICEAGEPRASRQLPAASDATNAHVNSLGMTFISVPGVKARFCTHETRVKDYETFRSATSRAWTAPGFAQGPTHPVVNVSWEDATAFCQWLTGVERNQGTLTSKQRYRLPTDREWSAAAGVVQEQGKSPEDRMKTAVVWPWGHYWPPLPGDGNYAPELKVDAFPQTAPVGSFKHNVNGLFDVGGNVWEWCEDWYNNAGVTKTMRGGSFNDAGPAYLLASYRFSGTMNLTNEDIGFRIVLEESE